jgi:hypothetical protein
LQHPQLSPEGLYVAPAQAIDLSTDKVYARLMKPGTHAAGAAYWLRGSLEAFADDWMALADSDQPLKVNGAPVRFASPEDIEMLLDQGFILETTDSFYRRDADAKRKLAAQPAGWTLPWTESV